MNDLWIWPKDYFLRDQSAWLVAHKFGYLNSIGGSYLGRVLGSLPGHEPLKQPRSRLFARLYDERKSGQRPTAESDRLRAILFAEEYSEHAHRISAGSIRHCPICIRSWRHSNVFQVLSVTHCPQHLAPLVSGCMFCDAIFNHDFSPEEYVKPLHCHVCGQPFAGEVPRFDQVFANDKAVDFEIGQFANQLKMLCHHTRAYYVGDVVWPPDTSSSIAYFNMIWKGSGFVDSRFLQSAPVSFRKMRSEVGHSLSAGEELGRLRSILRHYNKKFSKLTRSICGHRGLRHLDFNACGDGYSQWVELVYPKNACACCYVLAKWRSQFGIVFSLYRRIYENRRTTDPEISKLMQDRRISPWTATVADLSFGIVAFMVARSLKLVSTQFNSETEHFRVGSISTRDLQVHGVCTPVSIPILYDQDNGARALKIPTSDVQVILSRLSNVSMRPLELVGSRRLAANGGRAWGEPAADWWLRADYRHLRLWAKPLDSG